ncbi:MAG: hypothetical protein JRG76_12675 [Deltaproteobacteria bacterium]|nr:hypothetical protein [Deltaproteobacteria bacterium]MBW2415353.1 hypothetical protein [Deltaproteobacteria bacterium]
MTAKRFTFGLALLLALGCEGEGMTLEQAREALHQGIERAALEQFFEENGITYSVLEGDALGMESDLPVEANELSARYVATIPEAGRWRLLYRESIVVKVDFPAEGDRAMHVEVYRSRTGV